MLPKGRTLLSTKKTINKIMLFAFCMMKIICFPDKNATYPLASRILSVLYVITRHCYSPFQDQLLRDTPTRLWHCRSNGERFKWVAMEPRGQLLRGAASELLQSQPGPQCSSRSWSRVAFPEARKCQDSQETHQEQAALTGAADKAWRLPD